MVGKYRRTRAAVALHLLLEALDLVPHVEDIVTEDERNVIIPDEIRPDVESLGDTVRLLLHSIGNC